MLGQHLWGLLPQNWGSSEGKNTGKTLQGQVAVRLGSLNSDHFWESVGKEEVCDCVRVPASICVCHFAVSVVSQQDLRREGKCRELPLECGRG